MSIKAMNAVWELSPSKGDQRLLLLALADSANDEGVCWPKIPALAKKVNKSTRAVQHTLQSLVHAGVLSIQRGKGKGGGNLYTISVDAQPIAHQSPKTDAQPVAPGGEAGCASGVKPVAHRIIIEEPSLNHQENHQGASDPDEWGEPNQKKAKSPKYNPAAEPLPEPIDTPSMRAAWSEWCAYRAERKPPVTPRSAKITLGRFVKWGAEAAVQSIEEAISNGWQGVFEPKHHYHNGHAPAMQPDRGLTVAEVRARLAGERS